MSQAIVPPYPEGAGTQVQHPEWKIYTVVFGSGELSKRRQQPWPLLPEFGRNPVRKHRSTDDGYFQIPVMGRAARSFAVSGSKPKLSSMVRSTL